MSEQSYKRYRELLEEVWKTTDDKDVIASKIGQLQSLWLDLTDIERKNMWKLAIKLSGDNNDTNNIL